MKTPQDTIPFHPYYTIKDSVGICVYLMVFAGLVFFAPNFLGHPDNYQYNMIAQAINEHFIDRGEDHPVSYHDIPLMP